MKKKILLIICILSLTLISCKSNGINKEMSIFKDYDLETDIITLEEPYTENGKKVEIKDKKEIREIIDEFKKIEYNKLGDGNIYKSILQYNIKFNDNFSIQLGDDGFWLIGIKGENTIQYEAYKSSVEKLNSLFSKYIDEIKEYNDYEYYFSDMNFKTDKILIGNTLDEDIEITNREDIDKIINNLKEMYFRKLDDAPFESIPTDYIRFNENLRILYVDDFYFVKLNDEKPQYLLADGSEILGKEIIEIIDKYRD